MRTIAALELDAVGRIVAWSDGAEAMLGVSAGAALGRELTSLVGADGWAQRAGGERFHVSVVPIELRGRGPTPRFVALLVDDEPDRDRDRYLAGVVHDLRHPITVITIAARLLESLMPAQPTVARLQSAARNLDELVGELIDLGSLRAGATLPLARSEVHLAEIVAEACRSLQLLHPGRLIVIDGRDATVGNWDRLRVRRIVQNLIANALVHSPDTTSIRIACTLHGATMALTVENDCPEPPAWTLEQLFEPFHRAGRHGRHGLGLYVARGLARAHGGDVGCTWRDGAIVFTLTLPVAADAVAAPPLPSTTWAVPRRHPRVGFAKELDVAVGDAHFHGLAHDLSPGGLAFFSDAELGVDEHIRIALSTGAASLSLEGTVRHVHRERDRSLVGVAFAGDLSTAEIALLQAAARRS